MGSVNRVILVGNLGRDAEVRHTAGGQAVATLNLATTENWKDKEGQRQEKTEWHRVVVWGKTAEALGQYLTKGKQIAIEGRIETRQWDDKDGNKRYTTEIKADRVTLLGSSGGAGGGGRSGGPDREYGGSQSSPMGEPADMPEDDIPF
jgi:single-strand DNA-binding protein